MSTESTTPPASEPLDLTALTALEQAASPGPWRLDRERAYDEYAVYGPNGAVGLAWSPADAEFMAAARNALPALTAELEQARAKRDEVRELAARRESELIYLRAELATMTAVAQSNKRHVEAMAQELEQAKTLLHTIWHGTVNAPARERWLRLIADASPTAVPQAEDERWTWVVSCPGCPALVGEPCIGAEGGGLTVHPERRGKAVSQGYGLNAVAAPVEASGGQQAAPTDEPCCSAHNFNDLCSFARRKRFACCGDCPDWNAAAPVTAAPSSTAVGEAS